MIELTGTLTREIHDYESDDLLLDGKWLTVIFLEELTSQDIDGSIMPRITSFGKVKITIEQVEE